MLRPLILAGFALCVTACHRSEEATSVSINADGGNVLGAIDGETGEMKIDIPGFKGAVTLPKIKLDSGDFDLNGVKLYPGSTIGGVDVTDKGLRVRFASPAAPDIVRGWFLERLGKVGFDVHAEGANLVGTTDEKKPFKLELVPAGAGKASGTVVIGG
jgi:hypothetical protein